MAGLLDPVRGPVLPPAKPDPAENRPCRRQVTGCQGGQLPGKVYFFAHGYISRLAGKEPHANSIALTDIFAADVDSIAGPLKAELRQAIHEQRFAAIFIDADDPKTWDPMDFNKFYMQKEAVFDNPMAFWPISGYPIRPELHLRAQASRQPPLRGARGRWLDCRAEKVYIKTCSFRHAARPVTAKSTEL